MGEEKVPFRTCVSAKAAYDQFMKDPDRTILVFDVSEWNLESFRKFILSIMDQPLYGLYPKFHEMNGSPGIAKTTALGYKPGVYAKETSAWVTYTVTHCYVDNYGFGRA